MKRLFLLPLVLLAVWFAGCEKKLATRPAREHAPVMEDVPAPKPGALGSPQPKLQTIKLWLGTNEITAEIAATQHQVMTGMMWRTNMAEMEGMLFVFTGPHQVGFWMKNCVLPLSCAYIDPEGAVLETYPMEPGNTNSITSVSERVQYVLEMRQGWFDRHGVGPGAVARTELGSLAETFIRR